MGQTMLDFKTPEEQKAFQDLLDTYVETRDRFIEDRYFNSSKNMLDELVASSEKLEKELIDRVIRYKKTDVK